MTPFEIIVLVLVYIFCITFSIVLFMEAECDKFERAILLLVILLFAPLFTMATLGGCLAAVLHNYAHE